MASFRRAAVTEVLTERPGLQRVALDDGRAYVLTDLIGPVASGDEVIVNTTAVDLGLGTGGWHVVHWNLSRDEWQHEGGGHIMKLRYTSLQADVGAAEEHHEGPLPDDLGGRPVVACTLHSQVAVVAAVLRHLRPKARIAYVMTDGAALPLALSDLVHQLRSGGHLDLTITAGQAFGGDLEAVSVPGAYALALADGADVIVAGMGPGVVGTGQRLGTTSVEAAGLLDVAAALGGTPILAVRASRADPRPRHRGVSHHTRTVLDLVRSEVVVAVPRGHEAHVPGGTGHDVPDVAAILADAGLRVTTMGRGPADDPVFFTVTGAAAVAAADHVSP